MADAARKGAPRVALMKIFGVGMNYLQHTEELDGRTYRPKEPVIFLKPDSALLKDGKPFFVPEWAERFDYEAELVVRICRLGKGIPVRFAHRYWDAVTVGIDFTARDIQEKARHEGMPWTICKGFDGSAAIGKFQTPPLTPPLEGRGIVIEKPLEGRGIAIEKPLEGRGAEGEEPLEGRGAVGGIGFHLDKNGETVQRGDSSQMLFSVDEIISYLSRFFTLRTGDLIYTGTPAGIGAVRPGDHLQGYIGEDCVLDFYCR